ncbi:MAG: FAD-dependent oxidoreductase, partial [Oscillospiraceae bacterium]|nr:FAD-dependent oxidoreductase [Oscillospiraceae bacterium]
LMYGIPNMKLDKSVIERRVALMKADGVEFKTSVDVGRDMSAAKLLKKYDAVVLACGASKPRDLDAPGREAQGIYFAVDYLTAATKAVLAGDPAETTVSAKGKHVIVVGGGDTGNDCVGTAIRQGAASVVQLEMMPKLPDERTESNPWPEWPRVAKTDYGQEEAIAVFGSDPRVYETTVKEFMKDENGQLCAVKLAKVHFETNTEGQRTLVYGEEWEVPAELVLIAAGFLGTEQYVADAFGVTLDARSNTQTLPDTYATAVPGVFAAGDMHRGQSLVVRAIAEGRAAAKEVDTYLMGYTNLE